MAQFRTSSWLSFKPTLSSATFYFLLASLVTSIVPAMFLPVTLDEAYYYSWSRFLSFGYFDHPPGVALLAALSPAGTLKLLGPRFGTLLMGLATIFLAARLFWISGIRKWQVLLLSLLLFKFNLASLAAGILTTPDILLVFFWLLALHEAYRAMNGSSHRWLSAGLATGCGLLSKYTMVLIGPVFLIALVKNRRDLRTPWPYLGGLLAFSLLLPNLYWNSQNGWPTFAFQLRRLAITDVQKSSDLPEAQPSTPDSPEHKLLKKITDKHSSISLESSTPQKSENLLPAPVARSLDYLGGLLVLWGILLLPLLGLLFKNRRKKTEDVILSPHAKNLFSAALWFPIVFFGCISFFTKVEANWSAIYMLAAAPLLAPYVFHIRKGLILASILNGLLILIVAIHAYSPFLPIKKDRILKESFGFPLLAKRIELLHEPIFADTYQLVSMLRFYQSEKNVLQWVGMNRPSEFTNNPRYAFSLHELKNKKEFWLVTSDLLAPHFESFEPVYMELIKDCRDGTLEQVSSEEGDSKSSFDCPSVHQWSLIQYVYHEG